jgi:hypothetical protein
MRAKLVAARCGRAIALAAVALSFCGGAATSFDLADGVESQPAANTSVDPSVFGATGDGISDDAPAFAKAVAYSRAHRYACVDVRPGRYRLATPIFVEGGECFVGQNGMNVRGSVVLAPKTVAFQTARPLEQLDGLVIRDMMIEGGVNPIDIGLFHQVQISNVILKDYSGWGLSHVRGERHRIVDVSCWHASVPAKGCLSFAAPENSVNRELYRSADWKDSWWDRSVIESVTDIGAPGIADDYALFAGGAFSNTTVRHLLVHSAGRLGAVHLDNVQLSAFEDVGTDQNGSVDQPDPEVFGVSGNFKYSEIDGFYPAFSGNSHYKIGLHFHGQFLGSSVRNCALGGDNRATIGVKFDRDYGSYGVIEACEGSLFTDQPNEAWKAFVSIVGSRMSPTNGAGASISERDGDGFDLFLNTPDQGKTPNRGAFRILRALENGRTATELELTSRSLMIARPVMLSEGGRILHGGSISGADADGAAPTWTIDSHSGVATFREVRVTGPGEAPKPSATSAPIGGKPLAAGQCEQTNVVLKGAEPTAPLESAPLDVADPGDQFFFRAYVVAKDEAVVRICAIQAAEPLRSRYRVRLAP